MKSTRWIWALGGVSAASLGVIVGACASDNTSGGNGGSTSTTTIGFSSTSGGGASTITTGSSGSTTSITINTSSAASSGASSASTSGVSDGGVDATTGPTDAGSGSGSGSSSSSASVDAECYRPPTALHAEYEAGVYCPFSNEDGGKDLICAAGKHCCEPPESANSTSTCEPASTTCPIANSTDWQCQGAPDCASKSGTVCCGKGTIEMQAPQPHCGDGGYPAYAYVSGFTGASCKTTCTGTTSFQVCSKSSECPSGESCAPIEPKGGPIGYCVASSGSDAGAHDAGAHDAAAHDAGNACVAAGGACVALAPGSCPNGTVGSATMYSCGSGLGLECCLP